MNTAPGLRGVTTARERRREARPERFGEVLDEAELSSVDAVDSADMVRSVKPHESEESHEDRARHALPGSAGGGSPEEPRPRIDLSA